MSEFIHKELTQVILKCCFDVINELGCGFLETVYKNALHVALEESGVNVEMECFYEVYFRQRKVGLYRADLVVENTVIVETKCCSSLIPEHQAQVINYLKVSNIPLGLLVNFGQKNLEYKRLYYPSDPR